MLLENVNNKKCDPKLIFFNEKILRKIPMNFWHRKLTLNVKFWPFLTPPHYTNSHNSIISFGYGDFLAKIFPILYLPYENSRTRIAIMFRVFGIYITLPLVNWSSSRREADCPSRMYAVSRANVYYFSYKLECRLEITPNNCRDLWSVQTVTPA